MRERESDRMMQTILEVDFACHSAEIQIKMLLKVFHSDSDTQTRTHAHAHGLSNSHILNVYTHTNTHTYSWNSIRVFCVLSSVALLTTCPSSTVSLSLSISLFPSLFKLPPLLGHLLSFAAHILLILQQCFRGAHTAWNCSVWAENGRGSRP